MEVTYNGKTYEGATERELIKALRNDRLTFREIGKIMSISRQRVSQILGPQGHLQFPELQDPKIYVDSDEVISMKLGIPVSRVSSARRQQGLKANPKIDVNRRRRRLAKYLFGYLPGPNFVPFLDNQLNGLSEGRAKVLKDFYILGLSQSLSDEINMDSNRVYRHYARKSLKELVTNYSSDQLKNEGVING